MPRCTTSEVSSSRCLRCSGCCSVSGGRPGPHDGHRSSAPSRTRPGRSSRTRSLILIDTGTGATAETKSGSDGNFVFPNLQPGTLSAHRDAPGLPAGHDAGSPRRDRPLDRRRRPVPGGRADRAGAGRGPAAGRRDDVDHDREHGQQRGDREAAAGRPQHPELRAAGAGRGAERRARATASTTGCRAARSTSRSTASTTTRSGSAAAARASSCSRRSGSARSKKSRSRPRV